MNYKRTKIVATLSDKRCELPFLTSLYEAGMDVVRINTAHQNIEGSLKLMENIRKVSDRIGILIDTKGPEVRTTISDEPVEVKKDQRMKIVGDPEGRSTKDCIFVNYRNFAEDVPLGTSILIDDGEVELKVNGKDGLSLQCMVQNDGIIGSRKSVNVPRIPMNLPAISEKDKEYIRFAVEQGVDFIAHSFVRSREDVLEIQKILDGYNSNIKIIAKIENQQGVDHLDEILDHCYGIMVARGDLAIEIPYERIPGIQKKIINKCIEKRKPVIVATQMLHSMIHNPRPTRAEVSDIANAIYTQTDAIMLSGETAYGKYPVEAVKTMSRVAREIEMSKEKFLDLSSGNLAGKVSAYLSKVAVKSSNRVDAKAIIADTVQGRSVRSMAAFRGRKPIVAFCYSRRTVRELALSYGVYPVYIQRKKTSHEFLEAAMGMVLNTFKLDKDDIVVVIAGNFSGGRGSSYIEIGTVEYLQQRTGHA